MKSNCANLHGISCDKPLVREFEQTLTFLPTNQMSVQVPFETDIINSRENSSSITNFDLLLPDQVGTAQGLPGGKVRVLVDMTNGRDSQNEEVFSIVQDFPGSKAALLPSVFPGEQKFEDDRLSVVVDMIINEDGSLQDSIVYKMCTPEHAQVEDYQVSAHGEIDG